jgi:uncharacterized protein YwgA
MNSAQFLLALIGASGGKIQGRTLLQKQAFFVAQLAGIDPGLAFDAHFYGPYSSTVDNTIGQLKSLGFVKEETTEFGVISGGFEMRRYDYQLTDQGREVSEKLKLLPYYKKIDEAVAKIAKAGNPDYIELSIAAKSYFILKKEKRPMSSSEITLQAGKFNWNLGVDSVQKAVNFLKSVGLTRDAD